MFTWGSRKTAHPRGRINLLHTVPPTRDVCDQLRRLRNDDEVTIRGWEVEAVVAFDLQGNQVGRWEDMGCNTLLVDSVEITGKH
ncbi:MAG: hypothetical protein COY42_18220 [Armatimonadetes bacterium CG_4_10_14_0_8_um_filter_66_14]|nr:MAG: hypothetical protein COY42_18220 [Armatimonadetes bacterium CG_4_10_14_0_8_um_filter_66_14]